MRLCANWFYLGHVGLLKFPKDLQESFIEIVVDFLMECAFIRRQRNKISDCFLGLSVLFGNFVAFLEHSFKVCRKCAFAMQKNEHVFIVAKRLLCDILQSPLQYIINNTIINKSKILHVSCNIYRIYDQISIKAVILRNC